VFSENASAYKITNIRDKKYRVHNLATVPKNGLPYLKVNVPRGQTSTNGTKPGLSFQL
jgi:hypothetical protein